MQKGEKQPVLILWSFPGNRNQRRGLKKSRLQSKRLGMSNLVLDLRQGETLIINGASIRFRSKARVELIARARFLFGKQIMSPEAADTPARRLYLALQAAYV